MSPACHTTSEERFVATYQEITAVSQDAAQYAYMLFEATHELVEGQWIQSGYSADFRRGIPHRPTAG